MFREANFPEDHMSCQGEGEESHAGKENAHTIKKEGAISDGFLFRKSKSYLIGWILDSAAKGKKVMGEGMESRVNHFVVHGK